MLIFNSTCSKIRIYGTKPSLKLELNYTVETWVDTDKVEIKGYWKTTGSIVAQTINFYDSNNGGINQAPTYDSATRPNYLSWNRTTIGDSYGYAWIFPSDANFVYYWTDGDGGQANIYSLKSATDQNISSGTQYNFHFYLSIYTPVSSFNPTVLRNTGFQWTTYKQLSYYPQNFFSSEAVHLTNIDLEGGENPYIYGLTIGEITSLSYSSDKLTFTVSAPSGTTSTTKVHAGDKGKPSKIKGATNWSYDDSTSIVTINVIHPDAEEVEVIWGDLGNMQMMTYIIFGGLFGILLSMGLIYMFLRVRKKKNTTKE